MGILSWISIGLITGVAAKWIMLGVDPRGIIFMIALGIMGAIIGGMISTSLGFGSTNGFDIRSLLIAIIGTTVMLAGYRFFPSRVSN